MSKEVTAVIKWSRTHKCSNTCTLWDKYDRDCDVYGVNHPPILKCDIWLCRHWKELPEDVRVEMVKKGYRFPENG